MKYFFYYLSSFIVLFTNPIFAQKIEYKDWLNNNNFKSSLYKEVENLIIFQIPKIKNKEQEKIIIEEIKFNLNKISKYQNEFLKLRQTCQSNYTDISFNVFLDIEICIKEKNKILIKHFPKKHYNLSINHEQLFLNANEFTKLFINLHSHEVKKENYDTIMKNYYNKIKKINYDFFEEQFNLTIQDLRNSYNLNN